jgi:hypothetical protein
VRLFRSVQRLGRWRGWGGRCGWRLLPQLAPAPFPLYGVTAAASAKLGASQLETSPFT